MMRVLKELILVISLGVAVAVMPTQTFADIMIPCKKVALVIGNGEYGALQGNLPTSGKEATEMAKVFKDLGFEVTHIQDANRDTMLGSLMNFRYDANEAEIAIIYFSGYAGTPEWWQEDYLIPVDNKFTSEGRFQFKQGVPVNFVLWTIESVSIIGLVILDAVHNSPPEILTKGTFVAYAGKPGGVVHDGTLPDIEPGPYSELSPYTGALLRHFQMPDGKHADLGILFRSVSLEVAELTERRQVPTLYGSIPAEKLTLGCGPATHSE